MLARSRLANECSLEGHDGVGIIPDVAELVEYIFEKDSIFKAFRQLSPKEKQVFALHFDRFETSEIAEILQMTPAAVRQNLARARSRLKQLLGLKGAM
jgi:RNA polymerase sigma factor (sigma-70 family)